MAMTDSLERESRSPQWRLDIESDDIIPTKNRNLRWLRNWLWPSSKPSNESSSTGNTTKQLRRTAYLDGLRGFAAFLVYIHHNELWVHAYTDKYPVFESAYGYEGRRFFISLPFVRNFFSGGHSAVAVFYVISGYVLSAKPLALLQAGEHLKMADNLGSAFFRRWFRLYLPLLVTTFVYITSWHLFGVWNAACEPKDTYWEELANWVDEWRFFAFLFREHIVPWLSANTHLWSIPLEMRGSVVTFCALLALSRSTTKMRLWSWVALIVYFLYFADGYYCALFIAGMLQCDLDLLAGREETEGGSDDDGLPDWIRRLEPYGSVIFYHFFFVGMLLAGVPSLSTKIEYLRDENPGWYWLSYLKPAAMKDYKWFFLFWAANMIVASVPRLPWLKRFFESRFCQYLGRISFALYLVHGPILAVLGDRIYFAVGWVRAMEPVQTKLAGWINLFPLPKTGPLGLEIAFLVPNLFLLPFTLWVADFVTRMVDEPSVKFARWLHEQTLAPKKEARPQEVMRFA